MVEIELKARVADRRALEPLLAAFMDPLGETEKADEYWDPPGGAHGAPAGASGPAPSGNGRDGFLRPAGTYRFRIRSEDGRHVVTFKDKRMAGAMEVNRETEFAVDGVQEFRALLLRLGCRPAYRKGKTGTRWSRDSVTAEALTVAGLGDFLEVETICDSDDSATVARARAALLDVVRRCGLDESDLEPRHYSELLGVVNGGPVS